MSIFCAVLLIRKEPFLIENMGEVPFLGRIMHEKYNVKFQLHLSVFLIQFFDNTKNSVLSKVNEFDLERSHVISKIIKVIKLLRFHGSDHERCV